MKNRKSRARLCFTTILLFSVALSSFANSSAHFSGFAHRDGKSPGAVLKNFYYWYINAVEAGTDPFKKGRQTLQKYVTLRLIKQIEKAESDGSEADAFLQTQEWDKKWADGATVSNVRVKGATATGIVTFDATDNYPRVSVTLVKEGDIWKIDRIRNAPM